MMKRRCVKCYAETDEGALICKNCGSDRFFIEKESRVPCPRCGAMNEEGEKECYACGVHII